MVTAADIRWGSYKEFEGPYWPGRCKFVLPPMPTEEEMILSVLTTTEGGAYDAYNGYDKCICTSGLIQWCEAGQFSVSEMLGRAAERGSLLESLHDFLVRHDFEFMRLYPSGKWRFVRLSGVTENVVDTIDEQKKLFLLHSPGLKGTWDEGSKQYAKEFAAAISTVWENPLAQRAQADFSINKMSGFVMPSVKTIYSAAPTTSIGRAFKAAYLSFAGNNPLKASEALLAATKETDKQKWTIDWFIDVLRGLTFKPGFTIYPGRYDKIRPVLEVLYELDLPDLSTDLKSWREKHDIDPVNMFDIQRGLAHLGFDLGPAGADGRMGPKTKDAIMTFQRLHGLKEQDGYPNPQTTKALSAVLEARGVASLRGD